MIDLRHLRTLHALRETDSLPDAAEFLHLTQSALSHQFRELENRLGMLAFGMSSTYLQNLREHHPVDWLNIDTQTPLLLLQGLADEQISPRLDFEQWVSATGHRSACQWRAYEGLDHLFKRSQSGRPVQDYVRRRTIAAAVIRDLARWLHAPQVALTAKPANRGWSIDGKAPRPTPCCSIARQACPAPVRPR